MKSLIGAERGFLDRMPDRNVLTAIPAGGDDFALALLDASMDCVKLLSSDGRLSYMSCNGLEAMEIDDFDMVRDAPWPSLWPAEASDVLNAAMQRAREGAAAEFTAFCPTAKGTPRWWSVSVYPIRNDQGEVVQLLSVSRDITETRRAQEAEAERRTALDAKIVELEAALAERDHLVAEVDHRVKNSLGHVGAVLRLQRRGVQHPEAAAALDAAALRLEAVARVHKSLQAQPNAPRQAAKPFLLGLLGDLTGVLSLEERLTHELETDIEFSTLQAIQIGPMLAEMVQNAASADLDGQIRVTCRRLSDEIELRVEDQGPGLPEGFDPASSRGLGLRICRAAAVQLGGRLVCENRKEGGASFAVRFPADGSDQVAGAL